MHSRMVEPNEATGKTAELYQAVERKFGMIPNFVKALGNNPAFLESMLNLHATVFEGGAIPMKHKALMALALSMANGSEYCTSAFAAQSQMAGATEQEIAETRSLVALMSAWNALNGTAGMPCDISPS